MNCPDIVSLAPLYLSGELDAASADEFQSHLIGCASCCREMGLQAELDARLRNQIFAADVCLDNSALDQRIRSGLAALDAHRPAVRVQAFPWSWIWVTATAAAVLFAAILGYRVLQAGRAAPVCADAVKDHHYEVVDQQPRMWLSDRSAIDALAESRGVPAASVNALAISGHRLERGKLCRLDGRVYLHLVFTGDSQEFSVFLGQNNGEEIQGPARENVNGRWLYSRDIGAEHLASFQTSHLTTVIVTDQPGDAVVRFGRFAAGVL